MPFSFIVPWASPQPLSGTSISFGMTANSCYQLHPEDLGPRFSTFARGEIYGAHRIWSRNRLQQPSLDYRWLAGMVVRMTHHCHAMFSHIGHCEAMQDFPIPFWAEFSTLPDYLPSPHPRSSEEKNPGLETGFHPVSCNERFPKVGCDQSCVKVSQSSVKPYEMQWVCIET